MTDPVGGAGPWPRPLRVRGHEPVYAVGVVVLRAVVRVLLRLRAAGRLPPHGAAIVASNHVSYLDPMTLGVTLPRLGRRGRFLTMAALFSHPLIGPVMRAVAFIPVRPGQGGSALSAGVEALRAGELLVIYPEGHVAKGRVLPARPGVARLARETGAPVVPVAQVGMERGERRLAWLRRRDAAVVVGAPFHPAGGTDDEAAAEVLDRIRDLLPAARDLASADRLPLHARLLGRRRHHRRAAVIANLAEQRAVGELNGRSSRAATGGRSPSGGAAGAGHPGRPRRRRRPAAPGG